MDPTKLHDADVALAKVGSGSMIAGSLGAAAHWLTTLDPMAVATFAVSIVGLIVNWHFRRRRDRREQRLADARLAALKNGVAFPLGGDTDDE